MSKPARTRNLLYLLQLVSALVGLGVSLYLVVQHTRLKSGIQEGASFCSLGGFADCDVVNASGYSELAGIPLAAIGACFYFLLLVLGLLAPPDSPLFRRVQRCLAWLTATAAVVDIGLLVIQAVDLHTFCLMCLLTYIATFTHLVANLAMYDARGRERVRLAFGPEPGPAAVPPPASIALALIALLSFGTSVALIPYYVRLHSQTYSMIDNALAQFYEQWKEKPVKEIPAVEGDGLFGNPNARVRIVEFSDFQCPFCKRAAFTVHTVLKTLQNRVSFVFKHYPLDSSCNTSMPYQMHPQACSLARLAVCAQRKGKFWEYHDLVFLDLGEEQIKEGIDAIAPKLSKVFSRDEITQCLQDPKSLAPVLEDLKAGNGLGVKGTPSIFINGKQITIPVSVETLNKLIRIEEGLR